MIRRHPGIGSFVSSDSKDLQLLLLILGFGEADFRKYSHPFGDLIAGVAKVTWERQATFSIMHVPSGTADAESLMRSILSEERFDGIILRIAGDLQELPLVPLTEIDFPYVVVKRYLPDRMHNCVVEDDTRGALEATEHLLKLGHTRIGLIASDAISVGRDRAKGYLEALAVHGIDADPSLVRYTDDFLEESGYVAASRLVALEKRPSAIFAASDMLAFGTYRAIRDAGLRIPEDVSVVGYDDIPSSSRVSPLLTTVRTDYHGLGEKAASLLLDLITHRVTGPQKIVIQSSLVVRESCAARTTAEA